MKEILIALYFALHFAGAFLGLVIAIHLSFWLGLSMFAFFIIKFMIMMPSVERSIWFIQNAQSVVATQNLMNGQDKLREFALIVDSLWLYGFLGVAGFIIIYLADF